MRVGLCAFNHCNRTARPNMPGVLSVALGIALPRIAVWSKGWGKQTRRRSPSMGFGRVGVYYIMYPSDIPYEGRVVQPSLTCFSNSAIWAIWATSLWTTRISLWTAAKSYKQNNSICKCFFLDACCFFLSCLSHPLAEKDRYLTPLKCESLGSKQCSKTDTLNTCRKILRIPFDFPLEP